MSELLRFLSGLEFTLPWILMLLPLPLLVRRFVQPASRRQSALVVPFFADLPLDESLSGTARSRKVPVVFSALAWLMLLLAAAGPRWVGDPIKLPVSGRDTFLAVDLSASMEIEDLKLNGHQVNRLEVIKDVVSRFIDGRKGDRLGLVLFGTQAYLQAPLTFDIETVRTLLNEATIGIAGERTAIGDAIGLSVRQLRKRPKEQRVMILLTDGANTAGNLSPEKAAELAAKEGVTIYTIGVGAEEMIQPGIFGTSFGAQRVNPSADLDEEMLKQIANLSGGRYFRARSTDELKDVYKTIDKMEPVEQAKETFRPVRDLFFWPLSVFFILAGLLAMLSTLNHWVRRSA
ncbi:VWA domain-containing protein [Sansalvadorimonas sp. 2012CJ34-2]|uniref:VWA domain-containing protein n=1 Tax=Parendozoicomonas callyspongiae TaxID=2942213 RepID=A0ABT0PEG9_9GAMM|nr:VWA domain-containing protein [Sansalvadorimonas sp. 2012CJ34-2]MCL6269777.1 VWA domain-containing protein [Sansalvadorimonas sp. 2012CJ34-2]